VVSDTFQSVRNSPAQLRHAAACKTRIRNMPVNSAVIGLKYAVRRRPAWCKRRRTTYYVTCEKKNYRADLIHVFFRILKGFDSVDADHFFRIGRRRRVWSTRTSTEIEGPDVSIKSKTELLQCEDC